MPRPARILDKPEMTPGPFSTRSSIITTKKTVKYSLPLPRAEMAGHVRPGKPVFRPLVDVAQPWRLSHILPGHTSDVKAVVATQLGLDSGAFNKSRGDIGVEVINSASRDETARSWYRRCRWSGDQDERHCSPFVAAATYKGVRYQNAITHVEEEGDAFPREGMVIIGGLDARIRVYASKEAYSDKPQSRPRQILDDHYDNVCHLSVKPSSKQDQQQSTGTSTLLISASWDCTSRVWMWDQSATRWQHLHLLKGHERAVWAAEIVANERGHEQYLTASADLFVRLWCGESVTRVFAGHTDVVRSIVLLPALERQDDNDKSRESSSHGLTEFYSGEELFATTSNDGSLRIWSLDERRCPKGVPTSGGDALRVLQVDDGGNDLVYDACLVGLCSEDASSAAQHRLVATCGEGGLLRGWDIDGAKVAFEMDQPVTSVWAIDALHASGDLVTANSDGLVRVYTQRPASHEETAHRSAEPDGIYEASEAELVEHKELCAHVAMARRKGRVRADIVARETRNDMEDKAVPVTSAQGKRAYLDGREYDAVLAIDVSDDAEPLSLPINIGDDPRERAQHFIVEHNLPAVYEDQIVAFIEQVGPK